MIVLNEEHCLARALDSVKEIADEIIIVDTGSTDRTKEIARQYIDKVYDLPWEDDFSKARNFSLSKATCDWILVIDADEVIADEDHETLRMMMEEKDNAAYAFKQVSYTNDIAQYNYTPLIENTYEHKYKRYTNNFSGYIPCNIIRLFRNNLDIHFEGAVHESVDSSCKGKGNVVKTDLWLHHYQFERGADAMKEKQLKYLRIYEKNIEDYHDKARAYRDIGSVYYTYVNDYEKALNNFKKSLELNDKNKKTYVGLGMCYVKQNRINEAIKVFEMGLQIFPGDAQLISLRNMLRKL